MQWLQVYDSAPTIVTMADLQHRVVDLAGMIVGLVVVLLAVGLLLWDYGVDVGLIKLSYWQGASNTTSRSEVVRNLGLLAAAFIGLGFGIWRSIIALLNVRTARQQAATIEQGQITDRFSAAVEQLGSLNSTVRTGGVYALACTL